MCVSDVVVTSQVIAVEGAEAGDGEAYRALDLNVWRDTYGLAGTPRNPVQENAFLVPIVLRSCYLVLGLAGTALSPRSERVGSLVGGVRCRVEE